MLKNPETSTAKGHSEGGDSRSVPVLPSEGPVRPLSVMIPKPVFTLPAFHEPVLMRPSSHCR